MANALDLPLSSTKVEFIPRRSYYDLIYMLLLPSIFLIRHPLASFAHSVNLCVLPIISRTLVSLDLSRTDSLEVFNLCF